MTEQILDSEGRERDGPQPVLRRARADSRRGGYMWSTPTSAAFFTALIIVALILATLLAPVIDLSGS